MIDAPEVSERPGRADNAGAAHSFVIRSLVVLGIGIIVLLGWSATASADASPGSGGILPTGSTGDLVDTVGSIVDPVLTVVPPAPPAPSVPEVPEVVPSAPVVSDVIEHAPQPSVPTPEQLISPIELPGGGPAPTLPVEPVLPVDPSLPVGPEPLAPTTPVTEPLDDVVTPVEGIARPIVELPGHEAQTAIAGAGRTPGAPVSSKVSTSTAGPAAQLVGALRTPFEDLIAASTSVSDAVALVSPASPTSFGESPGPSRPPAPSPTSSGVPGCGSGASADRAPTGAPSAATITTSGAAARAAARTAVFDGHARSSSVARSRPEVAPD